MPSTDITLRAGRRQNDPKQRAPLIRSLTYGRRALPYTFEILGRVNGFMQLPNRLRQVSSLSCLEFAFRTNVPRSTFYLLSARVSLFYSDHLFFFILAVLYRSSEFNVLCVRTVLRPKAAMLSTCSKLECRQYCLFFIIFFFHVNAQVNKWLYPDPHLFFSFGEMDTVEASWSSLSNSTPLYLQYWCSVYPNDPWVLGKMPRGLS